ncbi:Uncharacterized protein HZ326_6086 [Fusarium oxysporum f. sp. albedinis]|nr:Uncharacterized protein HZ326_6086 [Fusarium oxysporum f. sp. albedinis]
MPEVMHVAWHLNAFNTLRYIYNTIFCPLRTLLGSIKPKADFLSKGYRLLQQDVTGRASSLARCPHHALANTTLVCNYDKRQLEEDIPFWVTSSVSGINQVTCDQVPYLDVSSAVANLIGESLFINPTVKSLRQ